MNRGIIYYNGLSFACEHQEGVPGFGKISWTWWPGGIYGTKRDDGSIIETRLNQSVWDRVEDQDPWCVVEIDSQPYRVWHPVALYEAQWIHRRHDSDCEFRIIKGGQVLVDTFAENAGTFALGVVLCNSRPSIAMRRMFLGQEAWIPQDLRVWLEEWPEWADFLRNSPMSSSDEIVFRAAAAVMRRLESEGKKIGRSEEQIIIDGKPIRPTWLGLGRSAHLFDLPSLMDSLPWDLAYQMVWGEDPEAVLYRSATGGRGLAMHQHEFNPERVPSWIPWTKRREAESQAWGRAYKKRLDELVRELKLVQVSGVPVRSPRGRTIFTLDKVPGYRLGASVADLKAALSELERVLREAAAADEVEA